MKHLITLFISILVSLSATAQSYKLYTSDAELSSALINDIFQDHLGVIWIATENGLTRFDGVKFYTYKNEKGNENSLAHNLVRCVTEDKDGNLYVGTHRGLQCFNRAKNNFTPIAKDEKGKLKVGNINRTIQLSNGEVWAIGNDLFKAVFKNGELYATSTNYPGPHTFLQDIIEDKEGNIWVTHLHDGIFVCKKKTNTVKQYLKNQKDVNFLRLEADSNGNVFVGTIGLGVQMYNKSTDSFETIEGTQDMLISAIRADAYGLVYIGSDGSGLYTYNITKKELAEYPLDNNFFNAKRAKVHAIMNDSDGDLWLGMFQKGVMFVKNRNIFFETIGHRTFSHNIIGSEAVTGITEDNTGRIWISTDNDGIYSVEKDGTSQYHFTHNTDPSFPHIITNLSADSKGRIWVASYTDGLGYFTTSGQYVKYPLYAADNGKEVKSVMDVIVDKEGRVWAATLGKNIYCIDTNNDQVISGCCQVSGLDNWQTTLHLAKDGTLCVGSYNGAYAVEVKNGKAKVIDHVLESSVINGIADDRNGKIWMATSNGLAFYDQKTKKSTLYTTADGLPTNAIYAVSCGISDCVWATSSNGLVQFGLDGKHRANFSVADGLQGNEFTKGASFIDSKGRFWFGGLNGITYFNPKDMSAPENNWDIHVTGFFLNNDLVTIDTKSGFWHVIDTEVTEAKEFNLGPNDNSFTIEFGIKQLNVPDGIHFAYTVNDGDEELLPEGAHGISFSNLPHGTYKIKVYVYGSDTNVCEVTVYVHTVWYNHWLAWIVYLVIFAFLSLKAWQYFKKWLHTNKELIRHKHLDEINKSKLQMFTNISHEIRTPMTLIISPLEKLMKDDSNEAKRHQSYNTMHRNASRILGLVNQLMDVRKIENGKMEMSLSPQNIIPIIGNICESFVEKAVEKNITFTYIHDGIDSLYANVDIQHFDKIFANLISNSMKFVPENGVVTVCVEKIAGNRVSIAVNDNGKGIPPKEREHIFERFYQVKDNDLDFTGGSTDIRVQATGGTGVGLHLAKALVSMHNGTIFVDDTKEGEGCRIIVELPIIENVGNEVTDGKTTEKSANNNSGNNVIVSPKVTEVAAKEPAVAEVATSTEEPETAEKPAIPNNSEAEDDASKQKPALRRTQILTNYHVLIVDDDPEIANYIHQELSDRYHCSICSNGKEALESVLKNPPHLVISDVLMPEMSGIELTKRIKANVNINHIPVILVTALSDTQSNVEGLNVGAAAYLTKPFDVTLLKTTVDNIIKSRQRLKNVYEGKQTVEKKIPKTELQTPDERLMKRVMKTIEQHIFDHNLSVELLASEVGISRVHLNRKLKELTNQTTTDFIKNIRLKRAAELLSQKKHSIAEVADMVGFQNANNFSTAFRKLFGMSPREYMAQNQGEQQ